MGLWLRGMHSPMVSPFVGSFMRRSFTDPTGRTIEIPYPPGRIVSLVPSITETLYDLGVWDKVAGCTGWCTRPAHAVKGMRRVGGVKRNMNWKRLREIEPELVLANAEEQAPDVLERLCDEFPTWVSVPRTVAEAVAAIRDLAEVLGAPHDGEDIAVRAEMAADEARRQASDRPGIRVLYLVWREPYMTVSGDTFIHDMLAICGAENVYASAGKRYPEITLEDAARRKVDLVLLPDEPFRYKEEHVGEFESLGAEVKLVSGDNICWPGSRMVEGIGYLSKTVADARAGPRAPD